MTDMDQRATAGDTPNGSSERVEPPRSKSEPALGTPHVTPRGRNLVVCLDGTGNQLKAHNRDTNVVLLYQMLVSNQPDQQLTYYDPGVGTFSAGGAWTPVGRTVTRLAGLGMGIGMRQNLGEAYTWLMSNWRPEDRIYLFGFSRGAYTARALAGMLYWIGMLRPGSENLVPYAVTLYARRGAEKRIDWQPVHEFSETFAQQFRAPNGARLRRSVPIRYLGLWDTVKAAGILRWDINWPSTRTILNADRIRHAIAIDEHRRPYREYVGIADPKTQFEEAWFAGVHSDVGGTFEASAQTPALSTIALKWITDAAIEEDLLVRRNLYLKKCAVTDANAVAEVHRMGTAWKLLTTRTRPIPAQARIHASVRVRVREQPNYQPDLPGDREWADEDWTTPRPPPLQP